MEKKTRYKRKIVKELYFSQALSCAELCVRTGKSFPIITKLLDELIAEGTVIETGLAPSTGGRRALGYSLKPGFQYIISVAMDQFVTRIALLDVNNTIVGAVEKIELPVAGNAKALGVLTARIESFIKESNVAAEKIIGIGIAMPGFVDVKKGLNYNLIESGNKSISSVISEATGIPVIIDNDSSTIALAELKFGSCTNRANALVINIGWGIGLGMILNSALYRGDNGFAGEFSHISLFSNNKLCGCGKTGCLETETSLLEIIDKAKTGLTNGRTSLLKDQIFNIDIETAFERIVKAAQKGDQFAIELISKAAYEIGRGISILIHLFNPEVIVLSGRGALAGTLWLAPIQQAINEFCIPRLSHGTIVGLSTLGYNAELIGAATLVMESYEKVSVDKNSAILQLNASP